MKVFTITSNRKKGENGYEIRVVFENDAVRIHSIRNDEGYRIFDESRVKNLMVKVLEAQLPKIFTREVLEKLTDKAKELNQLEETHKEELSKALDEIVGGKS